MQLYALDSKEQIIQARFALRQTDYRCLECRHVVRLRGGPYRQPHFYHLDPTPLCRQHQKGEAHLHLQSYFLQQFSPGDCKLELPFPTIRRIADVAWLSRKLIFEIQCSPISPEEVLSRNRDYQELGWKVIWILHDKRYNQLRLSSAEIALRHSPHYFTNMEPSGIGCIYDQFDYCEKGIRLGKLPPLPINIKQHQFLQNIDLPSTDLSLITQRFSNWNLSFSGDLIDLSLNTAESDYLIRAKQMEKSFLPHTKGVNWNQLPWFIWERTIARPYRIFFQFLLERMCR